MYGFKTFLNEIVARITGPLGFRFIIQPLVAILLGILDGYKDKKSGSPPYVMAFITYPEKRLPLLRSAVVSAIKPIIIGIITDAIAQYLIFKTIHPMQAVFVGTVIIAIPYVITRGLVNRISSYKKHV